MSKVPPVRMWGGVDAREGVGLERTLSAPRSLTGGLQEEEKNYDYLAREDQGGVKQRLELEKKEKAGDGMCQMIERRLRSYKRNAG